MTFFDKALDVIGYWQDRQANAEDAALVPGLRADNARLLGQLAEAQGRLMDIRAQQDRAMRDFRELKEQLRAADERAGNYKRALESCEKVLATTTQQRDEAGRKIRDAKDAENRERQVRWNAEKKLRERLTHEDSTRELAALVEQACAALQSALSGDG